MSGDFVDGGGDPSTRGWFKDRQRFCRQVLSPFEMGAYEHSRESHHFASATDEPQRHPPNVVRWELPVCKEPVATGYNPMNLCACHLALYLERKRKRGEPIMHEKARGGGLVLDFVENRVYRDAIAASEHENQAWSDERARLADARRARLEELKREADAFTETIEATRRELALAEAQAAEAEEGAGEPDPDPDTTEGRGGGGGEHGEATKVETLPAEPTQGPLDAPAAPLEPEPEKAKKKRSKKEKVAKAPKVAKATEPPKRNKGPLPGQKELF
jgi:hypothetical protein